MALGFAAAADRALSTPPHAAPRSKRTTTATTMRSAIICRHDAASRAASVYGVMSPNPTVENTVTAKYNAEMRVRC